MKDISNQEPSIESFSEKNELIIPNPNEEDQGIVVPELFEEKDEIAISEDNIEINNDPIISLHRTSSYQIKSETLPLRDRFEIKLLIVTLLTISISLLLWNSKNFIIKTGRDYQPRLAFSSNLIYSLPLAFILTMLVF